ncbi:M48 family metallopeptidase [Nocardiopsis ansamitocini]|uniref:Peptidase M48 domain-containing protein n=1 Tax=Nocardiopsis ansamitocini TaxID=1670832 RepID=A0A9W6UJS3_9ACTN|nr:M48 family metallopeptidase [Nocardiopsis ansamitocini]GLU49144.1 hypothetical protein Nans01_34950 [Nocardiopsis ansamitocini]
MAQAKLPENHDDTARFPYGAAPLPAQFPQGYAPGTPYRSQQVPGQRSRTVPAGAASARRHPWELPLLLTCLVITVGMAAALSRALWIHSGTPGTAALAMLGTITGYWLIRGLIEADHKARSAKVSPTQFPEVYRMLRELSAAMDLRRVPAVYVGPGRRPLLGAAGHGSRRYVVLDPDLFELGGRLRDPEALRFLIAHELGHIAAGHTGYWRRLGSCAGSLLPGVGSSLSRAMEYTADDHAYAHCPDGAHGLRVLVGGKYLYPYINLGEMAERARTERGFFSLLHNLLSRRPSTVRRLAAVRDRSRPGRVFG